MAGTAADGARMVTVDGRRLAYVTAGAGPPVVLIHGASGNHRDWTLGVMQRLAARHQVFAFDRPGMGASDPAAPVDSITAQAQLMRRAMAELGHRRVTLIGHSYGGSVALAWAVAAPDRVAGLMLISAPSHIWPGPVGGFYDLTNTPVIGYAFSQIVPFAATKARIRASIDSIFEPQPAPEGYIRHIRPDLMTDPARFRRNAAQVGALKAQLRPIIPAYPSLPMPITLIHGTADTIVPLDTHARPFAERVAHARLVALDGVGHMPHHMVPDLVATALAGMRD